jgi:argininosuccinate synthase
VNGTVTLALYKGNVDVAGRKSESSLYRPDVASFTMGASYNQKDAEGFIRILGLPARSRALVKSAPKMGVESADVEHTDCSEAVKSGVKK